MNLKKIYAGIQKNYPNIDFEMSMQNDTMFVQASVSAQDYFDDHVLLKIEISKSLVAIDFWFDKIEKSLEVYELINTLNSDALYFKGYIVENDKGDNYFVMSALFEDFPNEKYAIKETCYLIDDLLADDTLSLVQPICALTKE